MSRLTDDDVREAFRLRAVGRPSRGLRQRIRHSTRPAQQPRMVPAIHGAAPRRPIFARLTAIAAVAAILILAPVVGPGLDGQQLDMTVDSRSPQTAAGVNVTRNDDGENDGDDDDEVTDEGDDEDGIDEDDEGDDDGIGDDVDPEESEDDN